MIENKGRDLRMPDHAPAPELIDHNPLTDEMMRVINDFTPEDLLDVINAKPHHILGNKRHKVYSK